MNHFDFTAAKEEVYFQGNFGILVQIKVKFCSPVLFATKVFHSLKSSVHKAGICLRIFELSVLDMEHWPFSILDKRPAHLVHHLLKKSFSDRRSSIKLLCLVSLLASYFSLNVGYHRAQNCSYY